MPKLRLGVLGASWWTDEVMPGFQSASNAEVTWIAARRPERAEEYAQRYGIARCTTEYGDLLTAPDVDAVFVGLPNFLHEEMAIAALASGKHVLQEKPMALTADRAFAQAEIAARRGLKLMVDLELRLADSIRDLPEVIATRLGGLRKLVLGVGLSSSVWEGWRGDPARSGGTLLEMAIHQIDLARWLFRKDPVSVWGLGADVPGRDFTLVYDYGDGDSAIVEFCWRSAGFHAHICAYGPEGLLRQDIEMPHGPAHRTLITREGTERGPIPANVHGPVTFRRVLEGFAEGVLFGADLPIPTADGVWAVRIAQASRDALHACSRVAI